MYSWLAKILFAGWIVSSVYGGVANRADWSVGPPPGQVVPHAAPSEMPDPGTVARGAEKIAREAKEHAGSREFGDLTGSLAALALHTWDKMQVAASRSFAPGQPLPRLPGEAADELTISQAVSRMREAIMDAADVAIEASQVVSRRYPQPQDGSGSSIRILEYPPAGDNAPAGDASQGR